MVGPTSSAPPGATTGAAGPPTVPTRRNTELFLLLFAVGIVIAAQAIVEITLHEGVGTDVLTYGAGYAVLWGIAHLIVRRFAPYADPVILPAVALLNGLGLVMIRRLDYADAASAREDGLPVPTGDAEAQIGWMVVGLAVFIAVLLIIRDHRVLERFTFTLGLLGIVLLAIPAALPASMSEVNGAKIWIRLGGMSIQPGEFAKIALLVFFAGFLVAKRDVLSLASRKVLGLELPRGRDLGPILVAWCVSLLVMFFEKDLGSSLLFFGLFVVLLYIATERLSWLIIALLLFVGGAVIAYQLFAHVQLRVSTWLDPFAHGDDSFQIRQSLFGLGTGGLFGSGLGAGHPDKVPLPKSDFIGAAFGEELGLFGLVAILLLYILLIERGFRTALLVRDSFGTLLAAGLAFSVGLQVFVIIGGITNLIPLTGLTTPFLSYGGSSLVANFGIVALLVRISDAARRPAIRPPLRPPLSDARTEVVPR